MMKGLGLICDTAGDGIVLIMALRDGFAIV